MRLLLCCCFYLFLNVLEAKSATLDIEANGQTLHLPYWHAEAKKQNGAILIIGGGAPWDGNSILMSLANNLSKFGWSIALMDATTTTQWTEQIPTVLSALRKQQSQRVVLIYYGAQVEQLIEYFSKLQAKRVNGLVLLSAYSNQDLKPDLKKIPFPLFDVSAQFDYEPVLAQLKFRKENAKKGAYKTLKLPGAGHDYFYYDKTLAAYLHAWMSHLQVTKRVASPL